LEEVGAAVKRSTNLLAVNFGFGLGILIMVLGATHCAVAPYLMSNVTGMLMPGDAHAVLYMVLATGAATIFAGWMILFSAAAMRKGQDWAWRLAWRVTVFLVALGIGAVVAMSDNPFAQIMLAIDVLLIIALARSHVVPREEPKDEWPR
jgi:hypothetical protein